MNPDLKNDIENLFIKNVGIDYLIITNKDNKSWFIPANNIKKGLFLYQPSSIKGKVLKKILPYIVYFPFLYNKLNIKKRKYKTKTFFHEIINNIYNTSEICFSIFSGTESVHRKITIQLFNDKILGYCKSSNNKNIIELFYHEEKFLKWLENKNITSVPRSLFCNTIKNNYTLFIQSTRKTNKSKCVHVINDKIIYFLEELFIKTKEECRFSDSDIHKNILKIEDKLIYFNKNNYDILIKAIYIINKFYSLDKKYVFSAYHGDFTPWNIFIEKDNLFVFDFEYAQYKYPPFLDLYHFYTQTSIFEKKLSHKEIFNQFSKQKIFFQKFSNPYFYFILYLVDIISTYTNRDIRVALETDKLMETRLKLLNELCEYYISL